MCSQKAGKFVCNQNEDMHMLITTHLQNDKEELNNQPHKKLLV